MIGLGAYIFSCKWRIELLFGYGAILYAAPLLFRNSVQFVYTIKQFLRVSDTLLPQALSSYPAFPPTCLPREHIEYTFIKIFAFLIRKLSAPMALLKPFWRFTTLQSFRHHRKWHILRPTSWLPPKAAPDGAYIASPSSLYFQYSDMICFCFRCPPPMQ